MCSRDRRDTPDKRSHGKRFRVLGEVGGEHVRIARNAPAPFLKMLEIAAIGAPGVRGETVAHQIGHGVGQAISEINCNVLTAITRNGDRVSQAWADSSVGRGRSCNQFHQIARPPKALV